MRVVMSMSMSSPKIASGRVSALIGRGRGRGEALTPQWRMKSRATISSMRPILEVAWGVSWV